MRIFVDCIESGVINVLGVGDSEANVDGYPGADVLSPREFLSLYQSMSESDSVVADSYEALGRVITGDQSYFSFRTESNFVYGFIMDIGARLAPKGRIHT